MVTGVETVGIVLAILPLVVNQLDAYAQGIETIKGFRTRRYRRELQSYSTRLGTQRAILLNTLEQSLEGVVDYEDEISELIDNPRGPLWKDPGFQAKLRKKLDRDYVVFTGTMRELSSLLESLSTKLGLESGNPMKIPWNDATAVEREIKKFKDIFSKSIYSELLGKIDNANGALKTLIEQSHHREENRKRRRISKRPLLKYKSARKHATNLYNAIIRGKCWKCPCKDSHCVHLRIEPQPLNGDDDHDPYSVLPKFRMAFTSKTTRGSATPLWYWQEVETVPILVRLPVLESKTTSIVNTVPRVVPHRKIQFAVVTSALENLPSPEAHSPSPHSPILDMCSALCLVNGEHKRQELIGSILDESDTSHRYNMYLVEKLASDMETHSLEDLLISSSNSFGFHGSFVFNRRDRLFVAATLASSVLQFHGSWLKSQWGSRDILFAKKGDGSKAMVEHPYLSGHVLGNSGSTISSQMTTITTNLIRSEVLFPLGLALVELSLCQTLSALRIPEDDDSVDAVASLKTASRLLDRVYSESGFRYGDVVDKCLFWSGTKNAKFDDEDFQRTVFDVIVSPLLDDLRDFEGKSRLYTVS